MNGIFYQPWMQPPRPRLAFSKGILALEVSIADDEAANWADATPAILVYRAGLADDVNT